MASGSQPRKESIVQHPLLLVGIAVGCGLLAARSSGEIYTWRGFSAVDFFLVVFLLIGAAGFLILAYQQRLPKPRVDGVVPPAVVDVAALEAFAATQPVQAPLFATGRLTGELGCYEPGQASAPHAHLHEEAIYVVEGSATVTIAGKDVVVPAGSLVACEENVPHALRNAGSTRCVTMAIRVT